MSPVPLSYSMWVSLDNVVCDWKKLMRHLVWNMAFILLPLYWGFFFLNLYTYNKWNTTLLPTPRKAVYILILGTYCLAWQRDSEDLIRLRILRQRDYPELSGWAKCNYKGLYKRKPGNSEWEEGLKNTLLILKIEEGAIQEVQTSSRNWKR